MAEITPDSALAEVINCLDLASVPEKLHCSTCHGFLLNAYKTSCCEQNACEKCFNQITDHCPLCKHKPFSKELCRPAKAMRNTVKAYLRSVEKSLADERTKAQAEQPLANEVDKLDNIDLADAQASANQELENHTLDTGPAKSEEPMPESSSHDLDVRTSIEVGPKADQANEDSMTLGQEDEAAKRQASVESDGNDDEEVEIQVEPSAEDGANGLSQVYDAEEQDQQYDNTRIDNTQNGDTNMHDMSNGMDMNGFNMQNTNMMGFNGMGMDMNMMQQMMAGNMGSMMPMGMNPMFGGFGGTNGLMNGMNMMGMNFNPNQMFNGWNSQNSNMWQNNNAMNAMGGDFGSPYGSNTSQQGNFYSQQFPNVDYNGYNPRYGRGRGRGGRGFFGRGRGSFNQYQQNSGYHNPHEQQQYDARAGQSPSTQDINQQDDTMRSRANQKEEETHDQDDFAPGGQDEVQEALGDSDRDVKHETNDSSPKESTAETIEAVAAEPEETVTETLHTQPPPAQQSIIPEAYHEDFDTMAPPSAPTGPSGRYSEKEFALRARGQGKYSARARNSFSASTGFPASPIRSVSQTSLTAPSPPAKGIGVVGAPTGPRAMREPPAMKVPPRSSSNSGGFQIMGRASMQSNASRPKEDEQSRSPSPINGYDDHNDGKESHRHYRYEKHGDGKKEADSGSNYELERSDRDRDRKTKHSKAADYRNDIDMNDNDQDHGSTDRRASHRDSRYEKDRSRREEKHSSSSKHRSSRRHYEDEVGSEDEQDDYGEPVADRHRSSRNGKTSSKHEGNRDRDKLPHRERRRDRERDRDEERSRDKEDRHRKRSRHDRDREDEYDDPDDEESRHRSRRHKKDHHSSGRRERERDMEVEDPDIGLRISGRSNSNRQSALATPTSATVSQPPVSFANAEKDPHTLEREARNRERMQKEQQRREKAALDKKGSSTNAKNGRTTTSGGRRVSYKYEDEVERGMGAADEREKARWR